MKKSYNSDDINQKHGNELSKKLYRTITELSKRLDDARSCARNIEDLFSPSLQIQRRKFCEYCERLIFSDPVLYGRKGEELLWRKGYYDVVSTAKLLKKKQYSLEETANLQSHLNSGVGFYHHMISKLQCAFSLNMHNVIDFPICENGVNDNSSTKENGADWAAQAIHQCLIYLGDLSRYKLEIHPNLEPTLAVHYYMQAIWYKPNQGMPHNQMGTLAMNQNCFLDAVYHYMRCLACKYSFEGTTNNLISLFERNSKYIEQMPQDNENTDSVIHSKSDHIKNFLARFLLLIDIWYFDKTVSKVYNLCHQTFKDLEECLMYNKPTSESGDTPIDLESFESDSTNSLAYLSNDVLFKVSVICLLCITKLQSLHSLQAVSTVSAFTLAVYSHLVQNVITQVQLSILNYPLVEVEATNTVPKIRNKKKNKTNLRRRKFLNNESEESESSEDENNSGSSSDDSFMSDKEDILAESSDDETDIIGSELMNGISTMNGKCSKENEDATILINGNTEVVDDNKQKEEALRKMKKMDVSDMLEIISEQGLLQSIKILNDWLIQDASLLKSCGTNTRSLLRQITYLLNLINININNYKPTSIINLSNTCNIPLHEDVALRGLDILSKSQKNLDWDCMRKISLSIKEETIIRISKLMSFGKYLTTIPETGVSYDETENVFVCSDNDVEERKLSPIVIEELELQDGDHGPVMNGKTKDGAGNSKGQLIKMKHMGQLWLASEVRALENRVRGKSSLSPYLVLDADALIKYTFMVKHLVHSRKFIVLVPSAVVSALDDLKRENPEARDAIRWLESQFHRGNRFFRSQRPQEKASIPFIKYPKKKDKEMFIYIQIIECCYYLAEQQKGATNLVTLLIGNQNLLSNGENKEFSYVGLAQTAGVCIESITQFYGKWKKTTKENR